MPSQARERRRKNRDSSLTDQQRSLPLPTVALVGNPNSGKTTLFNALTGTHQKVANYPGVTVEEVSAEVEIGETTLKFTDLPGLYSLDPATEDEAVAVGVLRGDFGSRPDLLVCVVDANNLERNLYLVGELLEQGAPLIVALTMTDVAAREGVQVDPHALASELGVDVIPVTAHRKGGARPILEAIERWLETRADHMVVSTCDTQEMQHYTEAISQALARIGIDALRSEIRAAVLDPGTSLRGAEEFPEVDALLQQAREAAAREEFHETAAATRYEWANRIATSVTRREAKRTLSITDRIDRILVHRVGGLLVFLAVMYFVFQSIYTLAAPLMTLIEDGFAWVGSAVSGWLEPWPLAQSAIVDGLIAGLAAMFVFLPQILILFFFIAFLEGTGYLARAAFLMDRLLGWCGLNGRAFIPLLSSFACAVPGIMAARVMPDARSRLATILVAPLMSCSARLPVYVLLIGAFIEPQFGPTVAGITLFGMHLLGLVVAIPVVLVLNRAIFKTHRLPFLLELPAYQWPKWRDVLLTMYMRGKVFVSVAGRIIVTMSILVWALLYFPRSDEDFARFRSEYEQLPARTQALISEDAYLEQRQAENSLLGRFGKAIEPVFIPAGFDWRITMGILAAFPAREVIVPTLGIIFNLGSDVDEGSRDLRSSLQAATWPDGSRLITPWTAVGLMVFFALCCQCMATLATVRRETNGWKWPVFMFTYMSVLAYLGAVAVHQLEIAFS